MKEVKNQYGEYIVFEVAAHYMDDDIREELHRNIAPCTEQEFFDKYCAAHIEKYGEEFELNKKNPQY